ncbi:MAG: pyridoxamine 5'-phosphate oxidase family protein [Chloroflexi bacterium]|nr:pyridoxamine 5'-phosphate oxidase family protein [Chloroflexota bacterium]MCC6891361.1 pyridoxamine 5'-phosphate oxidase family protein [Anaerolineae bacterium]
MSAFKQVIQNEAQLREVLGYASGAAVDKVLPEIDDICRNFIEKSPFLLLGSTDGKGNMDVSPKGDPAGFVQVMDSNTLLIPDRPGNRRGDTLSNIIQNPIIGLLFLVPGRSETLRVNGTAQIVRDEAIRERFIMQGKAPIFVIAVTVKEAFFHCTKCVVRSKLWSADHSHDKLVSLGEAIIHHAKMEMTVAEADAYTAEDEEKGLY